MRRMGKMGARRFDVSGITEIRNYGDTECSCIAAEIRIYGKTEVCSIAADKRIHETTDLQTFAFLIKIIR